MDHHLRVLKERIEAVAVVGNGAVVEREGRGGEVENGEEEDLNSGENRSGVGVELDVGFVGEAEDETVGPSSHAQRSSEPSWPLHSAENL
jgi:hypothetical protein